MRVKESVTKLCKKVCKSKKSIIICVIVIALAIAGISLLSTYNHTPDIDVIAMKQYLEEANELTTAKLHLTSFYEYKDTGVKLFNRSDFKMISTVIVRAGIDMSKVEISEPKHEKDTIKITIPKATIQGADIVHNSIKYFDEKFSLFNPDDKEDANKANELAEKKAAIEAEDTGILELANKQAGTLITGLISQGFDYDYEVEVIFIE